MEKKDQRVLLRHKTTELNDPLSKSLPHRTSTVRQSNASSDASLRAGSVASNTIVCYEDISIDYSQYYKESPITFEDLLSDESNTSNVSSVSEEEGYVEEPGAVDLTRSSCEDRNALRAITYHKYRILQSCFTGWCRLVAVRHQKAVQFRHRHLLQQGWKAFRWNSMLGQELAKMGLWHHQRWKCRQIFLKWKATTSMRCHKRIEDAFYLWRHLTRLQISSCVSRLAAERKVVKVCWTRWKLAVQSVRQEGVAVQHFKFILLRKSFTALLIHVNASKQKQLANELSEAFHNTVIRRDCFMHWKLSYQSMSTARRHCECVMLSKTLRKWRENTASLRCYCLKLQEQAEKQWRNASMMHFFGNWHSRLLERRAVMFRTVLLLSRYFHLWNAHQKTIRDNTSVADNYYTKAITKHAFSQWRMKCLSVQGARENVKSLMHKELLQHYFDSWRNTVISCNSLRVVQQEFVKQQNTKLLGFYFTRWRDAIAAIQHSKAADDLFHLHLKQRTFGTWRLFIYQQTLRRASKLYIMEKRQNLLQKYFDQWVCETACSVGENVISTRLFSTLCTHRLRKAFLGWRQATRVSQAATKTQRMYLRKYFFKWQQKLEVRYTASNTMALSSQVLVVRKWFDKWSASLQLRVLTKTADKHYNGLLLKKAFCFVTMEYKRHQAAKRFFSTLQQSSLMVCFVRWKAVMFARRQLEGMKRSIKFQQHHVVRKCFMTWLKFTRARWQRLSRTVGHLNTVYTNRRLLTAWKSWKRQLLCHWIVRDHLKRKNFYCIEQCFHHWRTITEQSLESLSATFIAKFHVSSLSADKSTTRSESLFHEILIPHQENSIVISQYKMSALLPLRSGVGRGSIVELPVVQSTPVLSLYDEENGASSLSNETSYLQVENVKRQLFNDTDGGDLLQCSQSFKLSPPCHCLDAEVVNELTILQQDLDSSVNKLEPSLSQGSSSLISPNLTSEVVLSHSDDIISPPMEFSEQCNFSSVPVSSVETLSTISTQESVTSDSVIAPQFLNSKVTLNHSYGLFNKLISIVKFMQHYPVSTAFIAWHRYVQKRKSLTVLGNQIQRTVNHGIMLNTLALWKLRTFKVLEYKQLEISFLANSKKRILSVALQKWITVYHKRLKDNTVLNNLLISRNQHVLKNSFLKWKNTFEISIRIRNHMLNSLMLKCLNSWRNYCTSKKTLKVKIEHVQTKIEHATLLRCFTHWSFEARQNRMLRVCLQVWSHYTQVKVQLRLASAAFLEKRCVILKQGLFLKWKHMTCAIVAIQKLHHQNLLKSTFVTWRGLIVKKRESLFHQQQEDGRRIVTVTLAHWRKITKETRLAKNMNHIRLLHYGWKKWRYRIVQEQISLRIVTADNVHLIKKVFNAWRCVTLTTADGDCNVLLDDEEDTAALCLYFKQWKIKYMQKIYKIR